MGLRPKPLFWAERIEEKRQSERDLIGTGGKIDELYKVIEFRPNIKVMKYLPAADEMDAIKNENIYDGFLRFLYKGIIIKHNKTEPTYTKTSLFLCEKRRFFMARTEKGVVTTI